MGFKSEHIINENLRMSQDIRQARTQYAEVQIKRINRKYDKYYGSEVDNLPRTSSIYSKFSNYNSRYKVYNDKEWKIYAQAKPATFKLRSDGTKTLKVSWGNSVSVEGKTNSGKTTTQTTENNKNTAKKSTTSTTKSKNTKDTTKTNNVSTAVGTSTSRVKAGAYNVTLDVDSSGKPKTQRKWVGYGNNKKYNQKGVIEYEYIAPEDGEYRIDTLYTVNPVDLADNNIFVDGVKQKRVTDHNWIGGGTAIHRYSQYVNLTKGKHVITLLLTYSTYYYGGVIRKVETIKADTLNNNEYTLNRFTLSHTEDFNISEATIELFWDNDFIKNGYPYYPEANSSGLLFDFRDEVNIISKDVNENKIQLFGGYISTLNVNDDNMILTLTCADRLIDLNNRYVFSEIVFMGGDGTKTNYNNYTSKYLQTYGDCIAWLGNYCEIPLRNNVNNKTGAVAGESKNTGFRQTYELNVKKNKNIIDRVYKKGNAVNMYIGKDSSFSNLRTNYPMLRNVSDRNSYQHIDIWSYNWFHGKNSQLCLNEYPTFCIEYGLGDPKSEKEITTTTSSTSSQNFKGINYNLKGDYRVCAKEIAREYTGAYNKAQGIFNVLKAQVKYENYSNHRYLPNTVISRKAGNCMDIARLYGLMLKEAGVRSGYMNGWIVFLDGGAHHWWNWFYDDNNRLIQADVGRGYGNKNTGIFDCGNTKQYAGNGHKHPQWDFSR